VRLEDKPDYLDALAAADKGNLQPFICFLADTVIATKKSVLHALQGHHADE